MASFFSALYRNYLFFFNPPGAQKQDGALKFGILGAAKIAPHAFITPAKSHPDVIVYAVAARDKAKATAFAKKHGIAHVLDSYEAIIDDPAIDAVYIPLPNGLHFEWAHKALLKGKHVLLEKPSSSNADEAETLFKLPLLAQPKAPVLMEAFHSRFVPSLQLFKSTLDPPNISHVLAYAEVPGWFAKDDDIRFQYDLAGGSLMDLGTYPLAMTREAFGTDPTECIQAQLDPMAAPREKCDKHYRVQLRFPNGGVGEIVGGLRGPSWQFSPTRVAIITVTHKPVLVVEGGSATAANDHEETRKTRTVTYTNFLLPSVYHSVDIVDEFVVTKKDQPDKVVRRSTKKETKKAYTWREMGIDQPGQPWESTYLHMLGQFVNKIRGREGSGIFISHEDSIAQAKALDMIYEKSGLGRRPASKYHAQLV